MVWRIKWFVIFFSKFTSIPTNYFSTFFSLKNSFFIWLHAIVDLDTYVRVGYVDYSSKAFDIPGVSLQWYFLHTRSTANQITRMYTVLAILIIAGQGYKNLKFPAKNLRSFSKVFLFFFIQNGRNIRFVPKYNVDIWCSISSRRIESERWTDLRISKNTKIVVKN